MPGISQKQSSCLFGQASSQVIVHIVCTCTVYKTQHNHVHIIVCSMRIAICRQPRYTVDPIQLGNYNCMYVYVPVRSDVDSTKSLSTKGDNTVHLMCS